MAQFASSMRSVGVVGSLLLLSSQLSAQDVDSIRASYTLALPPAIEIEKKSFWFAPGSSSGTPTAYGAEFGGVFFGVGYQARTRYTPHQDGDAYAGLGLGNPRSNLGMELVYTSYTTVRHGFFKEGSFSFKIHRDLPANLAVAVGWEDAIHSSGTDGGS